MADIELVIKIPEECYKQIQKHIFSIAYDAIKTKEEKKQVEEKFNVVLAIKNGTPLGTCRKCNYNYGLKHHGAFCPNDIVCEYWESDGLTKDDFCSRWKDKESKE